MSKRKEEVERLIDLPMSIIITNFEYPTYTMHLQCSNCEYKWTRVYAHWNEDTFKYDWPLECHKCGRMCETEEAWSQYKKQ